MKLIHCWSTMAAFAAAFLLTSSPPLLAAGLTASAGDVDNAEDTGAGLSWSRVQRGFAAIESLYKSTNHERNVMAYLALRNGDAATAQLLNVIEQRRKPRPQIVHAYET